jgi:hypothetical protein
MGMEALPESPFPELEELLPQLHGFASRPIPELNFFEAGGRGFAENPISDMMALFMGLGRGVPPWLAKALVQCLPPEITADCINQVDWQNVQVEREVCKDAEGEGTKRLDIVITTDSFVLGIENKVFANANHNPFSTYEQLLNERAEAAGGLPVLKCLTAPQKQVAGCPSDWPIISYGQLYEQALMQWGKESTAAPFGKWHVFYQEFLSHLNTVAHPEQGTLMDDAAQTFVKEHFSALRQAQTLLDEFDAAIGEQGYEAVCQGLEEDTQVKLGSATWDGEITKARRFFPASWGGKSQLVLGYRPDPDYAEDGMLGWFVRAYLHTEEFDFTKLRGSFESLPAISETDLAFYPKNTVTPKGTWTESKDRLLALDAWPSVYTHEGALKALEALTRWVNSYRKHPQASE